MVQKLGQALFDSVGPRLTGSPGFSASPTGSVSIHLYDVDSCPPFVNGPNGDLLTFQPTWSTTIPWALPAWSPGAPNVSPNLAAFVQRFISRPAYAPGNFLGLAITEGSIAPNHYYGFDDFIKPAGTPDWAKRGYAWLFNETILQADEGCDFDFMRENGKG